MCACVPCEGVRAHRANFLARSYQAACSPSIPRITIDFELTLPPLAARAPSSVPRAPRIHQPMEEIAFGPSGWAMFPG